MSNQRGFTLLEVLTALVIFGVVSSGMAAAFVTHLSFNYESKLRSNAIAAAQQVMDELRLEDPATLPTSGYGTTQTVTVDGFAFDVTPEYCSNASYCISMQSRHIRIEVDYEGELLYGLETVYTQLR